MEKLLFKNLFNIHFTAAVVCISSSLNHAAVINLPEDYPSIQEAVEAASSGDVIQVNQHDTFFIKDQFDTPDREGIRIIDKDLTIIGTIPFERTRLLKYQEHSNGHSILFFLEYTGQEIPPESLANLLVIENSHVVFRNLEMNDFPEVIYPPFGFPFGTTAAPVQVVSGKLTLENVEFTGVLKVFGDLEITDSTIFGYSFYRSNERSVRGNYPIPALHVRNQSSPDIRITNTNILCETLNGTRPIVLENIVNGNLHITNSMITTGVHKVWFKTKDESESYWNVPDNTKGLPGILIVNCSTLDVDLNQSVVTGNVSANYEERSPSGPGIEILKSNDIIIRNGKSIGGKGLKGGFDLDNRLFQSSDGGNGMDVIDSTVVLVHVDLEAGKGGESNPELGVFPGMDGLPLFQDENSTVNFETCVIEWSLF